MKKKLVTMINVVELAKLVNLHKFQFKANIPDVAFIGCF